MQQRAGKAEAEAGLQGQGIVKRKEEEEEDKERGKDRYEQALKRDHVAWGTHFTGGHDVSFCLSAVRLAGPDGHCVEEQQPSGKLGARSIPRRLTS